MGGKESLIKEYSQDGLKKFSSNFMYVKTEDDPRYGKAHLFKENTTGKLIALMEKNCQDLSQVEKLREKILYHVALRNEYLLKNIGYTRREEENMCSGKDIFTVFVEWHDHDLDKEIAERSAKKVFQKFNSGVLFRGRTLVSCQVYYRCWLVHGEEKCVSWRSQATQCHYE